MTTTTMPGSPSTDSRSRYATRGIQGILLFLVAVATVGLVVRAMDPTDEVSLARLAIGPLLSCVVVCLLPGGRQLRLRDRLLFVLFALGASLLAYEVAIHLGTVTLSAEEKLGRALAGPYEEGLKLLAVVLLARVTPWATRRPERLVILAIAVGMCIAGVETLGKLPTLHPRAVFNRVGSLLDHASYTGIAVSGFVIARYLRGRVRWVVPFLTSGLGITAHIVNNRGLRVIHGRLLEHVDPLPRVMTSEQWFGAPHYDELWILVSGGFTLVCAGMLALLVLRIRALAGTREPRG